jgi:hypothetical protein
MNSTNTTNYRTVTQLIRYWVESDFKAPNLPLSLRLKDSGCHYNSIYNNTWKKQVKQLSNQRQTQRSKCQKHLYGTHWQKSDSTHHFFRNACAKSGSLRFSQFSGCWLILSVYILMSFDSPFVRLFGGRLFCYYPYLSQSFRLSL